MRAFVEGIDISDSVVKLAARSAPEGIRKPGSQHGMPMRLVSLMNCLITFSGMGGSPPFGVRGSVSAARPSLWNL